MKNRAIKDFLDTYVALPTAPGFAVLIAGNWGSGKTHFVKKYIEEKPNTKFLYISLYGASSSTDIDALIFRSAFKIFDHKAAKISGKILSTVLDKISISNHFDHSDFINKSKFDVFVFDDLERTAMPINAVLGYLNEFSEHDQSKVIIIANEREILDKERYRVIKEKLVGKSLTVEPDFQAAFQAQLSIISDDNTRKVISKLENEIHNIFKQSESENLRILRTLYIDLERIFSVLSEHQREHNTAIEELFKLLTAFTIEVAMGRIDRSDLEDRQMAMVRHFMTKKESAEDGIARMQKLYAGVDITSSIISDQALSSLIFDGLVFADEVRSNLNNTNYFKNFNDEPEWKTVWYLMDRDNERVASAISEMNSKFMNREYKDIGTLLHVFGLRIFLARNNIFGSDINIIVDENKIYIDDLFRSGCLEPSPTSYLETRNFHHGHEGLGIHEIESSEFKEVYLYLTEKRNVVLDENLIKLASSFSEIFNSRPDELIADIAGYPNSPNNLIGCAFLHHVDIEEICHTLIDKDGPQIRAMLYAIANRFDAGRIDRTLKEEKSWFLKFRDRLKEIAAEKDPITTFRIRQSIENAFSDLNVE
ncbi:MAG: P-loop NTPase fold protein [Oceanicaulis sp.]